MDFLRLDDDDAAGFRAAPRESDMRPLRPRRGVPAAREGVALRAEYGREEE